MEVQPNNVRDESRSEDGIEKILNNLRNQAKLRARTDIFYEDNYKKYEERYLDKNRRINELEVGTRNKITARISEIGKKIYLKLLEDKVEHLMDELKNDNGSKVTSHEKREEREEDNSNGEIFEYLPYPEESIDDPLITANQDNEEGKMYNATCERLQRINLLESQLVEAVTRKNEIWREHMNDKKKLIEQRNEINKLQNAFARPFIDIVHMLYREPSTATATTSSTCVTQIYNYSDSNQEISEEKMEDIDNNNNNSNNNNNNNNSNNKSPPSSSVIKISTPSGTFTIKCPPEIQLVPMSNLILPLNATDNKKK